MGFWQNIWSRILGMILSWILPPVPQQQPSSSNNTVHSRKKHLLTIAKCLTFAKSSRTTENTSDLSLEKAAGLIHKFEDLAEEVAEEEEEEEEVDRKIINLPKGLKRELMPRHVALILDGNRRWAKKNGRYSCVEGYEAGLLALGEFMRLCVKWDIHVISLFLFSSENWSRPRVEVDYLMETFEQSLKDEHNTFARNGARVSVIGDTNSLPISLQEVIKEVEEDTKKNTKMQVLLAMSYSGQNDITQACKSIATKVKEGTLNPEDVTKTLIEQELQTKVADIPCPDLLIRTSGELRISNYYLWQSAYTELYFADVLWPDFGEADFAQALRSYQKRGRRFGRN